MLRTRVWFPAPGPGGSTATADARVADGGPFPVVLFSHGLGASPDDYADMLIQWAAQGIVVVAPTYPLTNGGVAQAVPSDLRAQPADASFVLTAVLERSAHPGDPLAGALDADRVVAAGHSMGAFTTVRLFSQCCRDLRLDGAVFLAGDGVTIDGVNHSGAGFAGEAFIGEAAPLLFIHGDEDDVVPYDSGRAAFEEAAWPKAFVTLLGSGHVDPYFGGPDPDARVVQHATAHFLRWVLLGDDQAREALTDHATTPEVARLDDQLG